MNGDVMKVVMGIIVIVIAFAMFPIVLDGTHTVLSDANLSDYTGLESIVSIAPLIIFVGMLFGGGLLTFSGARSRSRKKKSSNYKY